MRAASWVILFQDIERLRTVDRDGWTRKTANFIKQLAAADHDELQLHLVEGLHREIRSFVGNEFAGYQGMVAISEGAAIEKQWCRRG
jgi:hypothetical protein